jgi:hypothetical protein
MPMLIDYLSSGARQHPSIHSLVQTGLVEPKRCPLLPYNDATSRRVTRQLLEPHGTPRFQRIFPPRR